LFAIPLKNHGVRQLGWIDIPKMMGKSVKIPWFQSAPSRKVVNLGFTVLAWIEDYEFLKSHWLTVVDQKKGGW